MKRSRLIAFLCVLAFSSFGFGQAQFQETIEPPLANPPPAPVAQGVVVPPPAPVLPGSIVVPTPTPQGGIALPPPPQPAPQNGVIPIGSNTPVAPPPALPTSITQPPEPNGEIIPAMAQLPGPAAAQAPVITLHVQTPPLVQPGKDIDYVINVANVSNARAHKVTVTNPIPKGATVIKSDPKSDTLEWQLGTMEPGTRRNITFTLKAPPDGSDVVNVARVHYGYGLQTTTKVAKPALSLRRSTAVTVQQHDIVTMRLDVTNSGLTTLENVDVIDALPPGIAHQYDSPLGANTTANDPQRRTWKISRLLPNETRAVDFRVVVQKDGIFPLRAEAIAGNTRTEAVTQVTAFPPKVDLDVSAPARQNGNQPTLVKITLKNSGSGVLRNLVVDDRLPPQCEVLSVSENGLKADGRIQWIVNELQIGQSRTFEMTVRSGQSGRAAHAVSATYRNGVVKQAEASTEFESAPALTMAFVADTTAVEVGGSIRLTISVHNQGSAASKGVSPTVIVPDSMLFSEATRGFQQLGPRIQFEPITLGPGDKQVYEVTLKGRTPSQSVLLSAELNADVFQSGPLRKQINAAITGDAKRPLP